MEGKGNGVIIRVFRVRVKPGKQGQYERMVREQILPFLRSQPGLMNLHAGARAKDHPDEFMVVSVWKDLDSVRKLAGDDWQKPVSIPGEAELVERSEVEHFEGIEAPGDVM